MPTYSYACPHCGHTEDRFLRMSEFKLELDCPKCSTPNGLQKVPTAPGGFQLRGGGYYATDFKNRS